MEKKIVFISSDASYFTETKEAYLGVYIHNFDKSYSKKREKINSSSDAELKALKMSVNIAVQKKYDKALFFYDCKSIKKLVNTFIEIINANNKTSYMGVWVKRDFVLEAHNIAGKLGEGSALKVKKEKKEYKNFVDSLPDATKIASPYIKYENDFDYTEKYIKTDKTQLMVGKDLIEFFKTFDNKKTIRVYIIYAKSVKIKNILNDFLNSNIERIKESKDKIILDDVENQELSIIWNLLNKINRKDLKLFLEKNIELEYSIFNLLKHKLLAESIDKILLNYKKHIDNIKQ